MNTELLNEWIKAKKAEDKAKQKRLEIEGKIEVPNFDGKSKTMEIDGFKVNFKKNESYALDQEAYKTIRKEIPESLRPEKIKFELDVKGFLYLGMSENDIEQEAYKKISNVVTFKTGKVTFDISKG